MAQIIHTGVLAYFGLGLVVGTAFVVRGAAAVAHGAQGTGLPFKLIIWPGSVGLWPVVAYRWWRASR